MDDHFANGPAFAAALDDDDPRRSGADRHAAGCDPCRQALEEGRVLLTLLKRAMTPPPEIIDAPPRRRG